MTKELKEFLEFMSKQEKDVQEKVQKMDKDAVIAFAAENGITLTAEDLTADNLSDDDIEGAAGGWHIGFDIEF